MTIYSKIQFQIAKQQLLKKIFKPDLACGGDNFCH